MIFDARHAHRIAAGKVHTLRLPAKRGKAGAPYAAIPLKLAHDYPVATPKGKDPLCHIRVTSVTRELFAPTIVQARAAGFKTSDDYKEWWIVKHEQPWLRRERFDLLSRIPEPTPELANHVLGALLARFDERWWMREVWVVGIELTADTPRFMAQQRGVAAGDGQYTHLPSRAVDPEAECIEAARLEAYAERARIVGEQQRASFRRDLEATRARQKAERGRAFRMAA